MPRRNASVASLAILTLALGGCERAPSVDILGSFFPIWLICIAAAILLTLVLRWVLVLVRLDAELGPRVIVYPSMVALLACSIWLICFRY